MKTIYFSKFPKAYEAYPKVVKSLILGQVNKFKARKQAQIGTQLPEVQYVVDTFQVDVGHLRQYLEICGFKDDGTIPTIYLTVLAQSLQMQMMSCEEFAFDILGLVHIANHIKQMRIIHQHEHLTLSCQFGQLQPHDKGVQFDFIIEVKIANDVVMTAKTTYLVRQKTAGNKNKEKKNEDLPNYEDRGTWSLPEDLGRRYAVISGDFNLIHLHEKTAKLFGFKRAIAHGMWTNAKALASVDLPPSFEMNAQFKLPIFLPAVVEFLSVTDDKNQQLLVKADGLMRPHLTVDICALL